LAVPLLRHRLLLTAAAEVEGESTEAIVSDLVRNLPAPR